MTNDKSITRIDTARKCLTMITRIASRGAASDNPLYIGYALEELSQVLFERTGSEERIFEPVSANLIRDLDWLLDELLFVDTYSFSKPTADPMKCPPDSVVK